ncbi:Protein NBR1-like protein [Zea mays]|uniref:Protein NBR1-like protein n=1 Tax=Zea mays TaxID=4577 RepID=A0A1D6MPN6_MAIZE|nr:Protein NBR1-like protein [Zea mays]
MSDRSSPAAPTFFLLARRPRRGTSPSRSNMVIHLKGFMVVSMGIIFYMNLSTLRARIDTAFKFGPDVDFVLTYTDEDGDIVMIDDDDDLRDAALRQKLNPLRITVQLKKNQPTAKKILLP